VRRNSARPRKERVATDFADCFEFAAERARAAAKAGGPAVVLEGRGDCAKLSEKVGDVSECWERCRRGLEEESGEAGGAGGAGAHEGRVS